MYKGYRDVVSFGNFRIKEENLSFAEKKVQQELVTGKGYARTEAEKELKKKIIAKGIVSADELNRDEEYISKAKKSFEDATERSEILEAILEDVIEKNAWFGDCYTIKTIKYDDISNHTDFIVEIETEEGEILRIAIDVTVGSNDKAQSEDVKNKKASYVVKELDRGHGTKIKYFESQAEFDDEDEFKVMTLKGIPRAIISYPKDNLTYLCEAMAGVFKKPGQGKKEAYRMLEQNGLQLVIISKVIKQFTWQLNRLKSKKNEGTEIAKNLKKTIDYLIKLHDKKASLIKLDPNDEALKVDDIDYAGYGF
jgi:hypothetical protein